jgi:RNA polymerase sigma factor (sigma-70 family)
VAAENSAIETELIEGCRRGDQKHKERLYKHFYGFALGICLRYTRSRDEAVTILNDSFLKVFEKITNTQFSNGFRQWFSTIIVHTAIDYYRRESRHRHQTSLETVENTAAEPDPEVIAQLSVEDILSLLAELPFDQRLVFNMYEMEGYSHEEIAGQLGLSVSTSRVYLARAKEKMRKKILTYSKGHYERNVR